MTVFCIPGTMSQAAAGSSGAWSAGGEISITLGPVDYTALVADLQAK